MSSRSVPMVAFALALSGFAAAARADAVIDSMPGGDGPVGIVVDADAGRAFAAYSTSKELVLIDLADSTSTLIPLGRRAAQIVLNPVTHEVFVTNHEDDAVTIVDARTLAVASVAVGKRPFALAVDRVRNLVYVVNSGVPSLSTIDAAARTVSTSPLPVAAEALAVDAPRGRLYLTHYQDQSVTIHDLASGAVTRIPLDQPPWGVAVNATNGNAYVTTPGTRVAVIDGATRGLTALTVTGSPGSISIDEAANRIHLTHFPFETLTTIDGRTNAITTTPVQSGGYGAVTDAQTGKTYVLHAGSGSVTVLRPDGTTDVVSTRYGLATAALDPVAHRLYVAALVDPWLVVIDGTAPARAKSPTAVEFHHAQRDEYFLTVDIDEMIALEGGGTASGWRRTGQVFKTGGPDAVCRFQRDVNGSGPTSFFYTGDVRECLALRFGDPNRPRWNFSGDAFASTAPAQGVCATPLVPIYRAYNASRGGNANHRFAASFDAIAADVARGWRFEGIAFCAPR